MSLKRGWGLLLFSEVGNSMQHLMKKVLLKTSVENLLNNPLVVNVTRSSCNRKAGFGKT
jgi:hypothetical protein